MKKILIFATFATLLVSCGVKPAQEATQTGTTETVATGATSNADAVSETGSKIALYYTLRDTDANGEIIDTNIESDGGNGKTFDVIVGNWEAIKGFEEELYGLKKGDEKSFTVMPEKGYGTGTITKTFEYNDFAPNFTDIIDKTILSGKITQTLDISTLDPEFVKTNIDGKNPGDIIDTQGSTTFKLISRDDKTITVEMNNSESPFFEKELAVGTTTTKSGATFKIAEIDGDKVTLDITNTNSPFYGKPFVPGATATIDNNGKQEEYKVLSIDEHADSPTTVLMEIPNPHPLANKTLYFTIKVDSVTPPKINTSTKTGAQ